MSELCQRLHECVNTLRAFGFPFEPARLPQNGIYVLFEQGEVAHGGNRIVRVGTHTGSAQLRQRLAQHFVQENKDRSIFRKNIGRCLLARDADPFLEHWERDLTSRAARAACGGAAGQERQREVERRVSEYIRANFRFAVFAVADKARRLELESKLISTVSLCPQCRPSEGWLGRHSPKRRIRASGLWLVNELYKQPLSEREIEELCEAGVR